MPVLSQLLLESAKEILFPFSAQLQLAHDSNNILVIHFILNPDLRSNILNPLINMFLGKLLL